jgi:serine phosphatase RsbU (regulator of sigma subunit)
VDGVAYLDLALVDVSGSGIEAGSRALLLSGAVGGLLGAVPAAAFLDQANGYLRRQRWGSGFASASYLRLDLASSCYEIRNAGHPPPLRWSEGERIAVRTVGSGTVLGVVDDLALRADAGTLRPGDALVLYTDGMIEDRSTHLDASIGRFELAVADGMSDSTLDGLAAHLASSVRGSGHDDRTVVVVWNDGTSGPAARAISADETVSMPARTFSLARRGRGAR